MELIPLSGISEQERLRQMVAVAQQTNGQLRQAIAQLESENQALATHLREVQGMLGAVTGERDRLYRELEELRATMAHQVGAFTTNTHFQLGDW